MKNQNFTLMLLPITLIAIFFKRETAYSHMIDVVLLQGEQQ